MQQSSDISPEPSTTSIKHNFKRNLCKKIFVMLQVGVALVVIRLYVPEFKNKFPALKPFDADNERVSRHADDGGHWFSQTSPFPLHVYSAFYDRRMENKPQIVIISQFADQRVDRCVVWNTNNKSMIIPGTVTNLNLNDRLVVCPLPANVTRGKIHLDVSLAWADSSTADGVAVSSFRVPVEVLRRSSTRGRLALCLSAVFQSNHWSPRWVVEWLEMQRLLGVERVVVYNQSMSHDVGRVFVRYSRRNTDEKQNKWSSDPFVVIRQTRGHLVGVDSTYGHQTSTMNDCMYRTIGSFRYIAFMDFDEVIVPRQNFSTIPELIDHLTSSTRGNISSFVFRNAHFFEQATSDNYSVNPSFSVYLSRRSRAAVSQREFVVKTIIDADSCVGIWVHHCRMYTERFRKSIEPSAIEIFEVDIDMALKHHYRESCNLHGFPTFYPPDACKEAMRSPVVDGVMMKYGDQLTSILTDRYKTYII